MLVTVITHALNHIQCWNEREGKPVSKPGGYNRDYAIGRLPAHYPLPTLLGPCEITGTNYVIQWVADKWSNSCRVYAKRGVFDYPDRV